MPFLTVALCIYRSNSHVKRAFYSAYAIACQRDDIELVIYDNNPQADREFIRALLRHNIKYISNKHNLGGIGSWMTAWRESVSDYILFLGDDDFLDPTFADIIDISCFELLSVKHDIIASLPASCMGSLSRRNYLSADAISKINSNCPSERMLGYINCPSINYLCYSMISRRNVKLDVLWKFSAYCPTSLTALDWAMSHGIIALHQILQLNNSYYIYNMANWHDQPGVSWIDRETLRFSKYFLAENQRNKLGTPQVQAIMTVNEIAVEYAYLASLFYCYSADNLLSFNADAYFSAINLLYIRVHLPRLAVLGIAALPDNIKNVLSLHELVETLSAILLPVIKSGGELRKFLLDSCTQFSTEDICGLIDAIRYRAKPTDDDVQLN